MDTSLKLYYVASDGTTRTFPEGNYEQAELFDFTVNKTRMGSAPSITATLEYPYCLDAEWERVCHFDDVYVVFNSERYYLKATPPSSKSNDKLFYKHDLTFVNERAVLETVYMIDDLENQTQNILLSNNTQITFFGDIAQFVERINQSMYFSGIGDTCVYNAGQIVPVGQRTPVGDGYYVVVDASVTNTDEVLVTLSNNTIADALKQLFEKWGVPYYFEGRLIHVGDYEAITETTPTYADSDGVLGAGIDSISGDLIPYEYGQPNSVLQVQRSNGTKQIYNRCSGTGSSDNIPYYYPNPTPSGTIHHIVEEMPGSTLTVNAVTITDYLKFSNLGESDGLGYVDKNVEATDDTIGDGCEFYFNGKLVEWLMDENGAMGHGPGYTGPVKQSLTFDYWYEDVFDQEDQVYVRYYHLKPTDATLMVCMTLKKPDYKLNLDFSSECTSNVDWVFWRGNNTVRIQGNGRAFQYDGTPLDPDIYFLAFVKTYQPSTTAALTEVQFNSLKTIDVDISNLVEDTTYWAGSYGLNQRYWSLVSTGAKVNLYDYGVAIASGTTVVDSDTIKKVVDKWVTPQEKLMPACYRLSDGKKKFYPAMNYPLSTTDYTPDADLGDEVTGAVVDNDNYLDENSQYYDFDNPYRKMRQKEHIYDFPDIKPSIVGMTNTDSRRIDMFEEFAYDTNDDNGGYFDENGNWNFNHPYFFAKMRPTDTFNLFAHAIDEAKMTIAMTSGNCAPCEFEIAVDKDTQKNLVQIDDNGDLVRDADGDVVCGRKYAVAPQSGSQQETQYTWTWIALKKDTSTYGEASVMPYDDGTVTIHPKPCSDLNTDDGDTFVILHIQMPEAYVTAAEQRLTEEIIKQMYADNSENFNFSLKYSKVYLGQNQDLIDVLNENVKVSAKHNGVTKDFFVSTYSYRMQATSPIPEISIGGLVETVEELKSVASAGGSFMQKVGEHIAENFGDLMTGFNKPFTRIVQQNNTQITNQIKGDFPKDYVITQDELLEDALVVGAGGRHVQKLLPGTDGQFLMMNGNRLKWVSVTIPDLSAEATIVQNAVVVGSSATEISDFRNTFDVGTYLVSIFLGLVQTADTGTRLGALMSAYVEYDKAYVCSAHSYMNGCGQLCMNFLLEVTDDTEVMRVYAVAESAANNKYSVVTSVTNNNIAYSKPSYMNVLKIS